MQRNPTLAIPLTPGHFRTTQTPSAGYANPLGAKLERRAHSALHSAAEGNTPDELESNVFTHKDGVELWAPDFLDIDEDFTLESAFQILPQCFNFRTLLVMTIPGRAV